MRGSGPWTYAVVNLSHILGCVATLFGSVPRARPPAARVLAPDSHRHTRLATTPVATIVSQLDRALWHRASGDQGASRDYLGNPFFNIKFPAIALGLNQRPDPQPLASLAARGRRELSRAEHRQLAVDGRTLDRVLAHGGQCRADDRILVNRRRRFFPSTGHGGTESTEQKHEFLRVRPSPSRFLVAIARGRGSKNKACSGSRRDLRRSPPATPGWNAGNRRVYVNGFASAFASSAVTWYSRYLPACTGRRRSTRCKASLCGAPRIVEAMPCCQLKPVVSTTSVRLPATDRVAQVGRNLVECSRSRRDRSRACCPTCDVFKQQRASVRVRPQLLGSLVPRHHREQSGRRPCNAWRDSKFKVSRFRRLLGGRQQHEIPTTGRHS
jgi:hypothetical protein